ncbi:hypothetical protein H4Q26_003484 [Puccinia striiformis f. sp. tritici PST-130]|nr:hypothetical protein H4Q26_003484 [Puccinia striiformis f. sp. tritici PST-130]
MMKFLVHQRPDEQQYDQQARLQVSSIDVLLFISQRRSLGWPVNFALSADQQAYQDLARRFTVDHIIPVAAEYDRTMEYLGRFERSLESRIIEHTYPAEYGGLGIGLFESSLISEEIAYGCTGIQTAFEASGLAQAQEPLVAAYCVTEPGAGSDVAGIKTHAVKKGSDFVLNGSKMWITNGGKASWYFVLAKTDPDAPPHKSMSGFIVDATSPGIIVGKKEVNMGQRCSDTRQITFEDVVIPSTNLVGAMGEGFKVAMAAFDMTRPLVASGAVGLAQRALSEAVKYAQTRKTMGKPIIEHQSIGHMLAEMTIGVESARAMVWKSTFIKDTGHRNTYYASIAKCLASEVAVKNAGMAVQIFGGAGFNTECNEYLPTISPQVACKSHFPDLSFLFFGTVFRSGRELYRDSKIFTLYEGTSQIQRLIISKFLPTMYPVRASKYPRTLSARMRRHQHFDSNNQQYQNQEPHSKAAHQEPPHPGSSLARFSNGFSDALRINAIINQLNSKRKLRNSVLHIILDLQFDRLRDLFR